MKVERKGSEFELITITLETEEEAIAMWAKLNMPSSDVVECAKGEGVTADKDTCFNLFSKYDDVFDPTK